MCGIFALLNNSHEYSEFKEGTTYDGPKVTTKLHYEPEQIKEEFMKGVGRGPEDSQFIVNKNNYIFGFHRLAINGLNDKSNQPLTVADVTVICNGEIYNYKKLYSYMGVTTTYSDSDCEAIIYLYIKYGIQQTLTMLDGVYSFLLYDNRNPEDPKIFAARDTYGVRPLYILQKRPNVADNYNQFNLIGFASDMKCLHYFYEHSGDKNYKLMHFRPGTYSEFKFNANTWQHVYNKPHVIPSFSTTILTSSSDDVYELIAEFYGKINTLLNAAVKKRCQTTERPIACLLSGGLDSSLIAALVCNYFRNEGKTIETYSIGLEGSEDLRHARIVAEWIGSSHTEILVKEDDMFYIIPEVIQTIESYDTTTVRASLGNYILGKYISGNSDAKVIFNGDGSDEVFGGYLYMDKCPDDIEFDKETRELLTNIHAFDVLRSDKCISSHGLEPRTPFLDRSLVNYVLSIPPYYRNHMNIYYGRHGIIEKVLLRGAFTESYFRDTLGRQLLPDSILWRKKEAFSDGVSTKERSLFTILQEKIAEKLTEKTDRVFEANIFTEKIYYKSVFEMYYPECDNIIPHYWMPKYIESHDPSARTLPMYEVKPETEEIRNIIEREEREEEARKKARRGVYS
jgi:asparagine synthase (glutamine-hydrolysing)